MPVLMNAKNMQQWEWSIAELVQKLAEHALMLAG